MRSRVVTIFAFSALCAGVAAGQGSISGSGNGHEFTATAMFSGPRGFAMPAVAPDTLVIHGEHDDVVPLADALEWARPQHLPIVVLPQAEHFFHGRLTQLRDIVKRHFTGAEI